MAALAFVGSARTNLTTSGTVIATTARSFTAGNHVIVFLRWEGSISATSVTVTDTAGNTYTAFSDVVSVGSNVRCKMFYSIGIAGNASNVVTATFGASRSYRSLTAVEISGDTPAAVSYDSAISTGTRATLGSGFDFGEDSFIVAGGGNFNFDSTNVISDRSGGSWSDISPTVTWANVAHSARPTGKKGLLVDVTGTVNTQRVLAAIAFDSGVNVPEDYTTGTILSQMASEVLITNTNPGGVLSQMAVEVLRPNSGPPGPSTVPPLIFTAG